MSDELTRAIAEAIYCEMVDEPKSEPDPYCMEHGEPWPCPEPSRVAAALAPLIEARVREALLEAKAAEDARVDEVMRRMGRDHLQQIMARDGHSKGSPEWHRHDQGRWAFRQSAAIVDREHGFKRDVYGSWSEEWSPR